MDRLLATDAFNSTTGVALSTSWANQGTADDSPSIQLLDLCSADAGLAYTLRWWAHSLPGLLQLHRLLPDRAIRYGARFERRPSLQAAYADLFDLRHGPGGVAYPFLYAHSVNTLLQTRVLADLGLNGRRVRHLRHSTRFPSGAAAYLDAAAGQLDCGLRRVVRIGPTEVLVLLQTRLVDAEGAVVALLEDAFVAHDLQVAYAVQAEEDDLLRRTVSRMRRRQPLIDAAANDVCMRQLYIAADAGRRFGRVSGERSPVHAHRFGAWLWGRRCAQVQTQYLHSLIVREFAEWGSAQDSLQVTFCCPARLRQTLHLLRQGDAFELVDESNRLVAFGKAR
jgi:hypothetical protein